MKYKFPTITHIDDVLPALEGRDEFVIANREEDEYQVVNYNVNFHDTFDIDVSDGYKTQHGEYVSKGVMRRECRGIIFDKDGYLISRPVHKFFNVSERSETDLARLDLSNYHTIMEKVDGSMIRPVVAYLTNDNPGRWIAMDRHGWKSEITYLQHARMATKMGFTDIADMADQAVSYDLRKWMVKILINHEATPIFEFTSPENRIVVQYDEPKLTLLAVRNLKTGNYWPRLQIISTEPPCDLVPVYGQVEGNANEYMTRQKEREGREGDVIQFNDGHMVKIKNDWYLRIHRVKDQISNDRRLLDLIVNNGVDDVLPNLDQVDRDRIVAYETAFKTAYENLVKKLDDFAAKAKEKATMPNEFFEAEKTLDRKMVATVLLPESDIPNKLYGIIFGYLDGKTVEDQMLKRVRESTSNTRRYNDIADLLGLSHTNDDLEDE